MWVGVENNILNFYYKQMSTKNIIVSYETTVSN